MFGEGGFFISFIFRLNFSFFRKKSTWQRRDFVCVNLLQYARITNTEKSFVDEKFVKLNKIHGLSHRKKSEYSRNKNGEASSAPNP